MNKLILLLIVLFASNAFAAPAMNFKCGGLETVGESVAPVEAVIEYSDWQAVTGYATQTLSVTDPTELQAPRLVDLQELRNAANNTECVNLTELESIQSPNPDYQYYKFQFSVKCIDNKAADYNLEAYCDKM